MTVLPALLTLYKAVSQIDTVNDLLPRGRLRGEKRLWKANGGCKGEGWWRMVGGWGGGFLPAEENRLLWTLTSDKQKNESITLGCLHKNPSKAQFYWTTYRIPLEWELKQ